jgi:D-alanyl-D-alanine carboxypeptidase
MLMDFHDLLAKSINTDSGREGFGSPQRQALRSRQQDSVDHEKTPLVRIAMVGSIVDDLVKPKHITVSVATNVNHAELYSREAGQELLAKQAMTKVTRLVAAKKNGEANQLANRLGKPPYVTLNSLMDGTPNGSD